jgi:hypothetical protein
LEEGRFGEWGVKKTMNYVIGNPTLATYRVIYYEKSDGGDVSAFIIDVDPRIDSIWFLKIDSHYQQNLHIASEVGRLWDQTIYRNLKQTWALEPFSSLDTPLKGAADNHATLKFSVGVQISLDRLFAI